MLVRQGSCGGTHTLVLTAEGRIFTWGRGSFGRLGTGVEKDCYSPVEVFLPGAQAALPCASAMLLPVTEARVLGCVPTGAVPAVSGPPFSQVRPFPA